MKRIIILLMLFLFVSDVYGQIGFEEHLVDNGEKTPFNTEAIFSADIDGDGDMDVLSAPRYFNELVWYENLDGEGNFGDVNTIFAGSEQSVNVYAADLDGDNDIDVLLASKYQNDASYVWFENLDGQGNFGEQRIIMSNSGSGSATASEITASDIDGDGDMDVLVGGGFPEYISWYENIDGQGNFSEKNLISTFTSTVVSLSAVDIDGDGDQDVLTTLGAGASKLEAWFENEDGLGTFGEEQIISTDLSTINSVLPADIDGDDDIDVLVTLDEGNVVAWYENYNGQGDFGTKQLITTDNDFPQYAIATDLDGDSDLDVAIVSSNFTKLVWYENLDGLGSFQEKQLITDNIRSPKKIIASDLDGDGDQDLVIGSSTENMVSWFENTDGQGSFGPKRLVSTNIVSSPHLAKAADLDGDGDNDLVVASDENDILVWYENINGEGEFGIQQVIELNIDLVRNTFLVDVDGDTDIDILSCSAIDGEIYLHKNLDGLGSFGTMEVVTTNVGSVDFIHGTDVDLDGDVDIIMGFGYFKKIAWCENTDGQGAFGPPQIIIDEEDIYTLLHVNDLDGDGDMDIISTSNSDEILAWYENLDGQGTFSAPIILGTSSANGRSITSGDIDGDNDIDIVLSASGLDDRIIWFENIEGQVEFGDQKLIAPDMLDSKVELIDVDGDEDLDVAIVSLLDNKISWYENINGQGDFGVEQFIAFDISPRSIESEDIDGDGIKDLLVTTFGGKDSKIVWYENLGITLNEIAGTVSFDINENNCDTSSYPVANVFIATESDIEKSCVASLNSGLFQFFLEEGNYTTYINAQLADYISFSPQSSTSSFNGIGNIETVDFCLEGNQQVKDLNITLLPISEARPGFESEYILQYQNSGTVQLSGSIKLEFESQKITFLESSDSISTQTNNSISFDFVDLNPFELRTIYIDFIISQPPVVDNGDTLNFKSSIEPVIMDFTPHDNFFIFEQIVVGSYDPNDITVLQGETITTEETDNYLNYVIRFQNTGTASAINVRVENALDARLDWQTIQPQSISHDNRIEIVNDNQVSFIFDGINLPDSTSNEPASHGYITYKIKPKDNVEVGDIISNKVDIYFDFNPPIETNTVTTEIVKLREEPRNLNFNAYPIPTSGELFIKSTDLIKKIEIYNTQGELLLSNENQQKINIASLSKGFYFCKVENVNGTTGVQKVIKE